MGSRNRQNRKTCRKTPSVHLLLLGEVCEDDWKLGGKSQTNIDALARAVPGRARLGKDG